MLVELFPDARNVGILYCSAEPNSVYQATEFGKYLDEDGISHKEYTVADSNDIASVVQSAVGEVDVIYIPTDNTMAGMVCEHPALLSTHQNAALIAYEQCGTIPNIATLGQQSEEGVSLGTSESSAVLTYVECGTNLCGEEGL